MVRNGTVEEAETQVDEDSETDELQAYFNKDEDNEPDETPNAYIKELNQVLSLIGGVINCLLRLSVAISNPAPHDRFKSRAGGQIESSEPWDIQHVRAKFPYLDKTVAERVGRALTQRRKYFKYREDHHSRLKQGLKGHDNSAGQWEATTVASSLPQHLKDADKISLNMNLDPRGLGVFDENCSEGPSTSYAASTFDQSELRVPPIPKGYAEGPFLCPFCYVFISVQTRYEWK